MTSNPEISYGSGIERQLVEDLARLQKSKGRGGSVKMGSSNGSRPQRKKFLTKVFV